MSVSGYLKLCGFLWVFILIVGWVGSLIALTRLNEIEGVWWAAMSTVAMLVGLLPGVVLVAMGQWLGLLEKILYELKRRKV